MAILNSSISSVWQGRTEHRRGPLTLDACSIAGCWDTRRCQTRGLYEALSGSVLQPDPPADLPRAD